MKQLLLVAALIIVTACGSETVQRGHALDPDAQSVLACVSDLFGTYGHAGLADEINALQWDAEYDDATTACRGYDSCVLDTGEGYDVPTIYAPGAGMLAAPLVSLGKLVAGKEFQFPWEAATAAVDKCVP